MKSYRGICNSSNSLFFSNSYNTGNLGNSGNSYRCYLLLAYPGPALPTRISRPLKRRRPTYPEQRISSPLVGTGSSP
jgi:hypothetical protein